jgi:hypothetical protein
MRSNATHRGDHGTGEVISVNGVWKSLAEIRPLRVCNHCFFDPTARPRGGHFFIYPALSLPGSASKRI